MVWARKRGTYIRCFSALRVALSTADLASSALPEPCPRMPCSRPSNAVLRCLQHDLLGGPDQQRIDQERVNCGQPQARVTRTSTSNMRSGACAVQPLVRGGGTGRLTHLLVADHHQRGVALDAARPGALAGAVHVHHLQGTASSWCQPSGAAVCSMQGTTLIDASQAG